jgi:dolichol-phosphate mannosyltransferase
MTQRMALVGSAGRAGWRSGVAPLVDVVIFIVAGGYGMKLANAHLVSFGIAFIASYILAVRGQVVATGRGGDLRVHVHLLLVGLIAVSLRGAVLGLLTNVWGWPAQVAIVFAAILAWILMLPGEAFALRTTRWTLGAGEQWRVFAMGLVAIAFLMRLLYITQVELLPEDAYYWNYAQHLDTGYLDHPPMVAWIIWLGTAVFGNSEFGVRIGALCCAAVASLFAYRLTRNLFGEPSARVALVLMQVLPFFFLSGMLMTPDAPMTAAWAAALYFLERALIAGQARAWLLAGVSIGLGLISKYTIGMLIPAALLFVILDTQARRWLLRWEPYAALGIALLIFSPVILWNARHEWASFAFQTSRRLAETPRFALHKLLLSVLVLLTPTGFLTLLVSRLVRSTDPTGGSDEGGDDERRRWLLLRLVVLVPLAVFVGFSLRHDVKIDWTGALWVGAVPALATCTVRFGARAAGALRQWLHSAWGPTAIFMLLLYAAGLHYLALGLPGVGYSDHLELVPVGWRDLGAQVNRIADETRRSSGREPVIVGMDRYELASELTFYARDVGGSLRETSSRNLFGENGLMYERWASSLAVDGRPLILVAWDPHDISDELIAGYATTLEPPKEGKLTRQGSVVRKFHYRVVHGLGERERSDY